MSDDRLFVNAERTVLVTLWDSGTCEVATRETPAHTWGPPTYLSEEKAAAPKSREDAQATEGTGS